MAEVIMLCGLPASGKTTVRNDIMKNKDFVVLSRDESYYRTNDMLKPMIDYLDSGRNVILDATFVTKDKRSVFIKLCKEHNYNISCYFVDTCIEDCQINALNRMYDRYNRVFMTAEDIKEHPDASKDPNIFPISVLFTMNKELEKPDVTEGFKEVKFIKHKFNRNNPEYTTKAVFLDYDDTLRTSTNDKYKFPVNTSDIKILENRTKVLKEYIDKGYILLGISNQSGIERNKIPESNIIECFEHTNKLLGVDIEYSYCKHNVPPRCYCRKPQSGMVVNFIRKHKINISESIIVGDQTSDKTTAKRLGIKFIHCDEFFK